jgi:hypothetical protein
MFNFYCYYYFYSPGSLAIDKYIFYFIISCYSTKCLTWLDMKLLRLKKNLWADVGLFPSQCLLAIRLKFEAWPQPPSHFQAEYSRIHFHASKSRVCCSKWKLLVVSKLLDHSLTGNRCHMPAARTATAVDCVWLHLVPRERFKAVPMSRCHQNVSLDRSGMGHVPEIIFKAPSDSNVQSRLRNSVL